MADGVVIKIDGDDSGYKKTLDGLGKATKAGMADVKAGIDLAAQAMEKLMNVAGKGISYNADIEQMKTSFEVMTGSAEKASEVIERLRTMGAETPFEMTDLTQTTNLLMQYGFTADQAIDRLTMLGDIAQGNAEKMNSIAIGYAQMSSANKVNLQDIKQMINAGFNPLQEISERTGESMASLYDRISKGTITVEEITESMRMATSEGGRFFQSMEKQSQTLNGQLSTLKDNANQLLGTLTQGMSAGLRDELLPLANNLIGELQESFESGGVDGLISAATDMIPDLLGMMTGRIEDAITGVTRWLPQGAGKIMAAFPSALKSATAVTPQITTALFEVASVVTTDLVAMLPELLPVFLRGVGDLVTSVLKGTESIILGLFTGIEQAMHVGQEKIAGVWVDSENVAKHSFEMEVDIGDAENEIRSAYKGIRDALKTDLLSDDEKTEIINMIGGDYDSIKAKLLSFGLTEEEAAPIAKAFETAGNALQTDLLTEDQKAEILGMIGGDYDEIKAKLLSFGLTETEAASIAKAITEAGTALQVDLMTEEEKTAIINMIGDDYDAIKAKLLSFGLTEEEATAIADSVSEAGQTMIDAYSGLKIGIDATTLARLTAQANGSRIVLKGLLKDMGLNDTDIAQVTAVYDEMMGKIGESTPSIIEEIYDKLTDGEPDDEQTVEGLKQKIQGYIEDLNAKLEAVYAAKSAELDVTASDYAEKKAAIEEWYNNTKASITGMNTDLNTLVDTLAGAPTAVVQSRMAEFVQMEQMLLGFEEKIEAMKGEALSAAESAFAVVRSGAKTDEATIDTAVKFKVTQFKLDEQAAEDAYAAAVEKLNADFRSGKISQKEYESGIESAKADLDAAKTAAKKAFDTAFAEILQGIAESEGNAEAFDKAMQTLGAKMALDDFYKYFLENGGQADSATTQKLTDVISGVLGEAFDPGNLTKALERGDVTGVQNALSTIMSMLQPELDESTKAALSGKVGETWKAAIENGMLAGSSFDVTGTEAQLESLFLNSYSMAIGAASTAIAADPWKMPVAIDVPLDEAAEAGEALGTTATEAMADPKGAETSADASVAGLLNTLNKAAPGAYAAGYNAGKQFAQGYRDAQDINSPSRVMQKLGEYSGKGLEKGLVHSMERIVATARTLSGQIVTAAALPSTMRMNMPNIAQEVATANGQTVTPVYLDGKQIAQIQGHNNSMQLAWDNNRSAKGVGRK